MNSYMCNIEEADREGLTTVQLIFTGRAVSLTVAEPLVRDACAVRAFTSAGIGAYAQAYNKSATLIMSSQAIVSVSSKML